jgi:uncharacterized protein
MKCPVCDVVLTMTERQGIEIDACPQCRGVWLDRGELDKIIERANGFSERDRGSSDRDRDRDTARSYSDHDRDRPYAHHKRKSFWHELFD